MKKNPPYPHLLSILKIFLRDMFRIIIQGKNINNFKILYNNFFPKTI